MLNELQHPRDVEVDHPRKIGEFRVEKRLAASVGAGVVDQQANFGVRRLCGDSRDRVGVKEIDRQRANHGTDLPALSRGVLQRLRLAGD